MTIVICSKAGVFAENKDVAKHLREVEILPAIKNNETIILDFVDVESTTQSFVHALISEIFQISGEEMLNQFVFKNCNKAVESIITTVINYSLE